MNNSPEASTAKVFLGFIVGLLAVFVFAVFQKVETIHPEKIDVTIITGTTTNHIETITTSSTYEIVGPIAETSYTTFTATSITTSETITASETTTKPDDIVCITGYDIFVIDEHTIETTTTTTIIKQNDQNILDASNFVRTFSRGTYYCYERTDVTGGSGRLLMDCSIKDDEIKGSIACRYIYENYGYNHNGARTIVYLEVPGCLQMSGFYYVDDCCASNDTIDFFFYYASNCPFSNQGVLFEIACYIVNQGG